MEFGPVVRRDGADRPLLGLHQLGRPTGQFRRGALLQDAQQEGIQGAPGRFVRPDGAVDRLVADREGSLPAQPPGHLLRTPVLAQEGVDPLPVRRTAGSGASGAASRGRSFTDPGSRSQTEGSMRLDRAKASLRHFEPTPGRLMTRTRLRPVASSDLDTFFEHQRDPVSLRIGTLTTRERAEFDDHWASILADPLAIQRTVECDGAVVGYVGSFVREGLREVAYWYGREHWGKGIATAALREFLSEVRERPLFARVTVDHTASRRVLEKVGFYVKAKESILESSGAEVEEYLLQLD